MFEYVASGLAHTRISKKILRELPSNHEAVQIISDLMKALNFDHHKMSFLFNAYTELELGKIFNTVIHPGTLHNIYADSGGLQMVTLGHTSDDEMKSKVYEIQSNLSTVGMAFDEIPIQLRGERSERNNTDLRLFDGDALEEKAKLTGQNLKNQIETYLANPNNKSRPMMIIQGNCYETYQRWTEIVLDEIGHNNWKYIKGVSSGAAALGQGALEDFKRLFYMTHLELPEEFKVDHYHLLGVGSLSRMLPIFPLMNNGTIASDCLISYDSTTHTSGISMGKYFKDAKLMDFAQNKDIVFYEIFNDINQNVKSLGFDPIDEDRLFARICQPALWNDTYGSETYNEFHTIFAYLASSVLNFMKCIDRLKDDPAYYEEFAQAKKLYMPLKTYGSCRDLKDFGEWERCFTKVLRSRRIHNKADVPPSLDSLF